MDLLTDYHYDALGNLFSANQSGVTGETVRHRQFRYDGLSRLVTAWNPETGVICYGQSSAPYGENECAPKYDGNGNLLFKTDARGVQTEYHYNAINQIITKDYSDGTPSECFTYDSAADGIGQLGKYWTAKHLSSGSCTSTQPQNVFASTEFLTYDPMGRVKEKKSCVLGRCTSGAFVDLKYDYDLAGNLTDYDSGAPGNGAFKIHQRFDSAGRMNQITSDWGSPTAPQSLWNVTGFTPTGAPIQIDLGTSVGVSNTYDSRQRITSSTATER